MLEIINNDLFNISGAVRGIDDRYFIAFNVKTRKYELHHSEQLGGTYCLTFPFPRLDRRAVQHVRYTRAERSQEVFDEIDRYNEMYVENNIKQAADSLKL